MTIFSLAFAALLLGLQSGVRAWRTVRSHQAHDAAIRNTFRVFTADVHQIVSIDEDTPPIMESEEDYSGDRLTLTTLDRQIRQRAGVGAVWAGVEYGVERDASSQSGVLVRTAQPNAARGPLGSGPIRDSLLTGVSRVNFDYGTAEGFTPTWDDTNKSLGMIRMTVTFSDDKPASCTVWVPSGALFDVGQQ
jgi:hypothetical protein